MVAEHVQVAREPHHGVVALLGEPLEPPHRADGRDARHAFDADLVHADLEILEIGDRLRTGAAVDEQELVGVGPADQRLDAARGHVRQERVGAVPALGPVLARAAFKVVVAVAADQQVVVHVAVKGIVADAAQKRVVAVAAQQAVVGVPAVQQVQPGRPQQLVVAAVAVKRVVVVAAVQRVVAVAAAQHVVAVGAVERVVAFVAVERVVAGRAQQAVVAGPAVHQVVVAAAVQGVVAVIAVQRVEARRPQQLVGAFAAVQQVGIAAAIQRVAVGIPVQRVQPGRAVQLVVARAAADQVVAAVAVQHVLAQAAVERIQPVLAIDGVAPLVADQHVVAGAADQGIVAHAAVQRVIRGAAVDGVVAAAPVHPRALPGKGVAVGVDVADGDVVGIFGPVADAVGAELVHQDRAPARHRQDQVVGASVVVVVGQRARGHHLGIGPFPAVDDDTVALVVAKVGQHVLAAVGQHEQIGPAAAGQHVVARAALQLVVAVAAHQDVVARDAVQRVVAALAEQVVAPGRAGDDVVARAAVEHVHAALDPGDRVVAAEARGIADPVDRDADPVLAVHVAGDQPRGQRLVAEVKRILLVHEKAVHALREAVGVLEQHLLAVVDGDEGRCARLGTREPAQADARIREHLVGADHPERHAVVHDVVGVAAFGVGFGHDHVVVTKDAEALAQERLHRLDGVAAAGGPVRVKMAGPYQKIARRGPDLVHDVGVARAADRGRENVEQRRIGPSADHDPRVRPRLDQLRELGHVVAVHLHELAAAAGQRLGPRIGGGFVRRLERIDRRIDGGVGVEPVEHRRPALDHAVVNLARQRVAHRGDIGVARLAQALHVAVGIDQHQLETLLRGLGKKTLIHRVQRAVGVERKGVERDPQRIDPGKRLAQQPGIGFWLVFHPHRAGLKVRLPQVVFLVGRHVRGVSAVRLVDGDLFFRRDLQVDHVDVGGGRHVASLYSG